MSIKISHLDFSYGENMIFHDLNCNLPDCGFVVILGHSGSGKTTFLSLLNGFLTPNSGCIEIDREEVSMVFQSPLLLNYLNVKENIQFSSMVLGEDINQKEELIQSLSRRIGISNLLDKFPNELSGGEMVRVSICRALAKGSKTLILDEPTGQLDETTSENIYSLLKDLSNDHLIIMVSHDEINATRLADELYHLRNKTLILKKKTPHLKNTDTKQETLCRKSDMKMKDCLFLTRRFLSKRKFRILFSVLFLAFNMTLFYLGMNLNNHMDESMQSLMQEYYANEVFSISMDQEIASSGKLHLKKKSIPDDEILSTLGLKETYYSLDYFIPSSNEIYLNKKTENVTFYPILKQKEDKILVGRTSKSKEEVVVNQSFLEEFSLNREDALKRKFHFSKEILLYTTQYEATDLLSIDMDMEIVGISKEKKAFNKPIVYYSYEDILSSFKKLALEKASDELGVEKTLYDMINDSRYDEEDFKGSSLYIYHEKPLSIQTQSKKIFSNSVNITSPSLETKASTEEILSSLLKILSLFMLLNTISGIMLTFLSVYSLYEENIRMFALIKAFGNDRRNVLKTAFGLQMILFFIAVVSTLSLSVFSTIIINRNLTLFELPNFLSLVDLKAIFLILFLLLVATTISALLPLTKLRKNRIDKELEGED